LIRDTELDAARAAYDHARSVYRQILDEAHDETHSADANSDPDAQE
jgi:hypothetical protein